MPATSTEGATAPAAPAAPDAATLLRLMALASPALPVGGFSYSEGLEAAVEAGAVRSEAQTADWLCDQLALSLARSELPAVAEAWGAWHDGDASALRAVHDWVRSTRESAEWRAQSEQMGRSLLQWLRNSPQGRDPRLDALEALPGAPTWPLVFALAALLAGADARHTLLSFAWSWAENLTQAATKAVPLGQAAAQRVLARLADAIPQAVEHALALPSDQRQAHAPRLAILSAQHETQYSRLFRS